MIRCLSQYVENKTAFVIGTDLFCGFRPSSASARCVVVLDRTGFHPSFDLTDKKEWPVQFLTRALNYDDAQEDAKTIVALFSGQSGIDLPVLASGEAYHIAVAEVLSGPYWLGQDQQGRHEFSTNMLLRMQDQ